MSKSIWDRLVGESLETKEDLALSSVDLTQSIQKINTIEKGMLAAIDAIGEPDYIGDFIQRGGLLGLEPMGFNAPAEITPDASHSRLAQVAVNHSRLESSLNRFKKSLSAAFETLNQSLIGGNFHLDASTQQALADIVTHREHAKSEIKNLVLKPKTTETMYSCFERLEKDTKELQKEFERCAKLAKK